MINVEQVVVIGATALLCGCLYALFRYSKLGIAMQAASQNQLAAYYMGIPVKRLNSLAWGLASAVAAIAGLLLAPITFVHANMGFIGLKAFPAAVVGGFGSLPGAIVGGLVIGLVESLAGFYLPEGFKDTAAYIVVLLMLVIKPTGLFGEKLRKKSDMRFIFKTEYDQDIRLVKHGGHLFWYGVLMLLLLAAPWLLAEYWLAQLTFVLIYSLAGLGLMLLAGYTGLFSLGHAAFLGVGAYTQAVLTNAGLPFVLALASAAALSAAVGFVVGLPALRVKGVYLGIATLSFGFIVEEVLARWESITGGNAGLHIKKPVFLAGALTAPKAFIFYVS